MQWPNLAIVTSFNDMLSAHQPFERFPGLMRVAAREATPRLSWRRASHMR
jgi:phosphogluconate dehydratase